MSAFADLELQWLQNNGAVVGSSTAIRGSFTVRSIGNVSAITRYTGKIADVAMSDGITTTTFEVNEGISNTEDSVELNNVGTHVNVGAGLPTREFFTFNSGLSQWEGNNSTIMGVLF